jgi:hypothetical protein
MLDFGQAIARNPKHPMARNGRAWALFKWATWWPLSQRPTRPLPLMPNMLALSSRGVEPGPSERR